MICSNNFSHAIMLLDLLSPLYNDQKQLKFYVKPSYARGPLHFAGKVTSRSLELEVLWLKHRQDHNSCVHVCKHLHDDGVITNLVCLCFDRWKLQSGVIVEWINWSNFLCKVYQSHHWRDSLSDLAITRDWGASLSCYVFRTYTPRNDKS